MPLWTHEWLLINSSNSFDTEIMGRLRQFQHQAKRHSVTKHAIMI